MAADSVGALELRQVVVREGDETLGIEPRMKSRIARKYAMPPGVPVALSLPTLHAKMLG